MDFNEAIAAAEAARTECRRCAEACRTLEGHEPCVKACERCVEHLGMTLEAMRRGSNEHCAACAEICSKCANTCEQFPEPEPQTCADACRITAAACARHADPATAPAQPIPVPNA